MTEKGTIVIEYLTKESVTNRLDGEPRSVLITVDVADDSFVESIQVVEAKKNIHNSHSGEQLVLHC